MIVVGIDPGFANVGYAVLRQDRGGRRLRRVASGTLRVRPKPRRMRLRGQEENAERLGTMLTDLDARLVAAGGHAAGIVGIESMSHVRSSATMAKVGMAWGAIFSAVRQWRGVVAVNTPRDVRAALGLPAGASKREVARVVGEMRLTAPAGAPDEHEVDAIANAVCAARGELGRLAGLRGAV